MLKKKSNKPKPLEIDLDGPQGNAFSLMANAKKLSRTYGYDSDKIQAEMQSGDYDHLLSVFVEYFPEVTLWRS